MLASARSSRAKLEDLAERVGFEPTIRLNTEYTISNRAPSTTRTPLRTIGASIVARRMGCVLGVIPIPGTPIPTLPPLPHKHRHKGKGAQITPAPNSTNCR